MIRVTLRSGETAEKLVQRFKRTVAKEGLLKEIKKRNFYEKPSEARRRKAREQEKLVRKKARKKAMKEARKRARHLSLGFH
ncbi:MAG: 30S ribosomal protein S21 [Planctomycetes bacterium]|nr:30S ribosomal protein S21 [Planctomycetota bacterium]